MDLDLDLGRYVTQVNFQFSLCIFAVFCSAQNILPTRIVNTTKDLRYLLNIYYGAG